MKDKMHLFKHKQLLLAAAVLVVLLCSAGCIHEQPPVSPVEIPDDMTAALDDFLSDIQVIDTSSKADSALLAEKLLAPGANQQEILHDYYADNCWITGLVIYNAASNKWSEVPVFNSEVPATLTLPTEEDFAAGNGFLHLEGISTPQHGYLNFDFRALYAEDGTYTGCIAIVYDTNAAIHLHPLVAHMNRSYSSLAAYYADMNGKIVYSSVEEILGKTIPVYDGVSVLQSEPAESGAYRFSSPAFYTYDRPKKTWKLAAWKKSANNHTAYLVKELNHPELKITNVRSLTTEEALANAKELFVYSVSYGDAATIDRVNSKYYSTPIDILDMNGTVAGSTDSDSIGLNYMNARGVYGISYISSAIHTTGHGGGYIYYTSPVSPQFDSPAAEYNIARVLPLNDEYFVFAQFAGDTNLLVRDEHVRGDVVATGRAVLREIFESGTDAVVERINANYELGGNAFVPNMTTNVNALSIVGFDGYIYASSQFPNAVGTIRTDTIDMYGGSTTRKSIMLAKNGGGITTCLFPSAEKEGYVDYWVLSIEPIDGTKHICTGTVLATFKDVLTPILSASGDNIFKK